MWILWPSFLVGAATSAAVFAMVDPLDIVFFGSLQAASRQQVYAGGFFLFWLMAALSSALSLHLAPKGPLVDRSEEHTSELQSLMRISYAVFCLKKKTKHALTLSNNIT